jgi:hypothetical protein
VYIPHQGFCFALLPHPTSDGLFLLSCRYGGFEGTLVSHIFAKLKKDPREKQVINLDQDVHVHTEEMCT